MKQIVIIKPKVKKVVKKKTSNSKRMLGSIYRAKMYQDRSAEDRTAIDKLILK